MSYKNNNHMYRDINSYNSSSKENMYESKYNQQQQQQQVSKYQKNSKQYQKDYDYHNTSGYKTPSNDKMEMEYGSFSESTTPSYHNTNDDDDVFDDEDDEEEEEDYYYQDQQQNRKTKKANLNRFDRTNKHAFHVSGTRFEVDQFYVPIKPLGNGAYGVVCHAQDTRTNQGVAIKKVSDAFQDLVDAKRTLREILLLAQLSHKNVIGLYDLINPVDVSSFKDIYVVLDYMETDLYKIIYSSNILTTEHIQYFTYQLLKGLQYIHKCNVIHRDLKPSNLLLNSNCDLKICDFGLARTTNKDEDLSITEYVVTRWYRAPEIMCSCQEYDEKIDIWSVGCILAELHGRKPLFPGETYMQQLELMLAVLGTQKEEDLEFVTNKQALSFIKNKIPTRKRKKFQSLYPHASDDACDLMEKMLSFNPNKRITVEEALKHPFLSQLSDEEKETVKGHKIHIDEEDLSVADETDLKEYVFKEILKHRPDLAKTQGKWLGIS